MFGVNDKKKEELVELGYCFEDLRTKSKQVLKEGDAEEKIDRILKNQIFLFKVFSETILSLK